MVGSAHLGNDTRHGWDFGRLTSPGNFHPLSLSQSFPACDAQDSLTQPLTCECFGGLHPGKPPR